MVTRSSVNRFSTHLQSTSGGGQLRNFVVCSNSFLCWNQAQQQQSKPNDSRQFPVLQQHRNFFSRGSRHVQQQTPDKKVDESKTTPEEVSEEPAKLGLIARFRKMYKEYWYVLVPVHCVTSVFWFGGFYYASTSGVDVIAILESMGVSEKLVNPVRDSSLGHIAIAYLLYKIATPARYTVTLGGTTVTIKYLVQLGYIKPIPSKAQLVQMYKDKKDDLQERIAEKKQDYEDRRQHLAQRKKDFMHSTKKGATDEK